MDHYERHCLWFNIFNTLDRVRLWNRLVFSEGYFRLLANPARHGGRRDLREYLRENLDSKAADELHSAPGDELDWYEDALRKSFEIKVRGRLGLGCKGPQEIRILNRIVSVDESGLKNEARRSR